MPSINLKVFCSHIFLSLIIGGLNMAYAKPLKIPHVQGTTTLDVPPSKVVVLDFATIDTLNTLGVQVAGVPTAPILPTRLKNYSKKAFAAGSAFEPNYEAIYSAKPDLIIVSDRSAPKYSMVSRIAPTIDLTPNNKDLMGSIEHNVLLLSQIFNKQVIAKDRLQKLHSSINLLKEKSFKQGTGLVIMTTGGKLSAYGPGSRFGIIHDTFGIKPADAQLKVSVHGQAISYEYILKRNPDWIFVIDRDAAIGQEGESAQRLLDNALIHRTKAWKNNHIIYLNTLNWYFLDSVGLTAIQENVNDLIRIFNERSR